MWVLCIRFTVWNQKVSFLLCKGEATLSEWHAVVSWLSLALDSVDDRPVNLQMLHNVICARPAVLHALLLVQCQCTTRYVSQQGISLPYWKLLRNSCSGVTVRSYFVQCWCYRSGVTISRQYKLHYEIDTCHTWSSAGSGFVGCIGVVSDATYTQKETDVCTEYDRSRDLLCIWWSESNCSGGQYTEGSWMSVISHIWKKWALNISVRYCYLCYYFVQNDKKAYSL